MLAIIVPEVVNPVNVPTDVIFGCAAVLTVPVNVVPVLPIVTALTVAAVNVVIPLTVLWNVTLLVANIVVALTWEACKVPVDTVPAPLTVNPVSVPKLVMFGCAAVCTAPYNGPTKPPATIFPPTPRPP